MRAWLAVVSVVAVMASSSAAAQSVVVSDGHTSTMSLNLFGSQSQVTFGLWRARASARRVFAPVVVSPPPVYVQPAPVYVQPPPVYVQPPQVIEAPPVVMSPPPLPAPPPPVVVAPVVVAPAPVVVAPAPVPQVVTRPPPPREPERPALIGIKYQPGFSGLLTSGPGSVGFSDGRFVHGVGLEARLSRWFALRSDVELRSNSRSYDVIGAKLWLAAADWKVKPFVSASLSGTEYDLRPNALAIGVVGSGGIDVFFGRHFFLTGEVKVRATPDGCCSVPQVTASAGAGVAFF